MPDIEHRDILDPVEIHPSVMPILDLNSNKLIDGVGVASAVNYIKVSNAISGQSPRIFPDGASSNIDLKLESAGTGKVTINGLEAVSISGTQTISNKTISGSSNTLSNISISSLVSGAVSGRVLVSTGLATAPVFTELTLLPILTELNGQTDSTQIFDATSSGTDFTITSGAGQHNFNIPTSSSSARGLLSSVDWTTFNNKQDALGYTPLSSSLPSGQIIVGDGLGTAQALSLSGDAVLSNTGVLTLSSVVTAGAIGSSSQIPTINYDIKGRIISTSSSAYQDSTSGQKGIVQIGSNLTITSGTLSLTSGNIVSALGYTPGEGDVLTVTASSPISSSGGVSPNISITQSGTSSNGYLSSVDWNTFNDKVDTLTQVNSGLGISGGGDLSTNRTLSLDITGLTVESTVDGASDYVVIYDNSSSLHKKVLINNLPTGSGSSLSWIDYVTGFSSTPTFVSNIASGDVYQYQYGATTLYRLVPSGVDSDSFYTTFSVGVLSGLVVEKEITI